MSPDPLDARFPDDSDREFEFASGSPRDGEADPMLDRLVAEYIDRLNRGEKLNKPDIISRHPGIADRLIEQLELFVDFGSEDDRHAELGTLGDYELLRQVGRGGMGVVYEAWQSSMERRVALKVLPAGLVADDKAFARFLREAKTAGQLDHPNVVHVFGLGVEDRIPYYAMDYVEGETLAQIIARLRDAPAETETSFGGPRTQQAYYFHVADTYADLADGLQHAHSKGVVHRDIKPSNIILDRPSAMEPDSGSSERAGSGRLRILDFGLARLEGQESLTVTGDLIGTPLYMSPEQARRHRVPVDHRTDVYSLGATLHEHLTGRPPFQGEDHHDTLSQIIERDPVEPRKWNPRIPTDLETIVLKCLRKDAADRYGTAEALGQDLRRFVRGDPIEARPQSTFEVLTRRLWRHRWRCAAGLLVLAFLITGSLLGLLAYRDAERQRREAYDPMILDALRRLRFAQLAGRGASRHELGLLPWRFRFLPTTYSGTREGTRNAVRESLEGLTEAVALVPHRADAYWHRARAHVLLGDEEAAFGDLVRALERQADLLPAAFLAASILEGRGETEKAAELRRGAESAAGAWAEEWVAAQRASRRKDWSAAADAFSSALRAASNHREPYLGWELEVHLARGIAFSQIHHNRERHLVEALREFALVRSAWPETLELPLLEADAWFALGSQHDAHAKALLEESFAATEYPDAFAIIAMTVCGRRERGLLDVDTLKRWRDEIRDDALRASAQYFVVSGQGHRAEARRWLREAADLDPDNSDRLFDLAFQLFNSDPEEAARLIERGLELAPDHPMVRFWNATRVACLARIAETEAAREDASRMVAEIRASDPDVAWIWIALAVASEGLGEDVDTTRQYYKRATELELDAEHYSNMANFLLQSARRAGAGRREALLLDTIEACEDAIEIRPGFSWPHSIRGEALELLGGRDEEAIASCRAACERHPRPRRSFERLAGMLEEDDPAAAFSPYVDAIAIRPLPRSHARLRQLLRSYPAMKFGGELERLVRLLEDPSREDPDSEETLALCRGAMAASSGSLPGRD